MVTVEYSQRNNCFSLEVHGHAGAAPKGMDIVCGAVSILTLTAAQAVLNLYDKGCLTAFPSVVLGNGNSLVAAVAVMEHAQVLRLTFETVMTGFFLLQEQYPEYVTVREQ